MPTKREKKFTNAITQNEKKIRSEFSVLQKDLKKMQSEQKKYIKAKYKQATTRDGSLKARGNAQIQRDIATKIKEDWKGFSAKWTEKDYVNQIMGEALGRGRSATANLAWSGRGYLFNIGKVFSRAPINIIEVVNDHFGTAAIAAVAIASISDVVDKSVNENDLRLSFETYPRSTFKEAVYIDSEKSDIEYYKMVVPKGEAEIAVTERPTGFTAGSVFMIGTKDFWANRRDDSNGNPLIFPIHHNSKDYYLPILTDDLEEEIKIAKEQRKSLKILEKESVIASQIKTAQKKDLRHLVTSLYNTSKSRVFRGGIRPKASKEERQIIQKALDGLLQGKINNFINAKELFSQVVN